MVYPFIFAILAVSLLLIQTIHSCLHEAFYLHEHPAVTSSSRVGYSIPNFPEGAVGIVRNVSAVNLAAAFEHLLKDTFSEDGSLVVGDESNLFERVINVVRPFRAFLNDLTGTTEVETFARQTGGDRRALFGGSLLRRALFRT
jgi:hypothetical protein